MDLSAVRPDDVEIGGADGRNWAGISRSDDPTGKSLADFQNPLSSPLCKNISVFPKRKSGYMICHPVPQRGALAIVTDAGRDAMDAAASGTRCDRFQRHMACGRMALFPLSLEFRRTGTKPAEGLGAGVSRTAKPCGPDAPTLASSWRFIRRRRWQESPVTGESTI